MEDSRISEAKNGTPSSEQDESDVDCSLITNALFTISMHQKVKLLTKSTMLKFFVGCVMWCGASELCQESAMTGSSTQHPAHLSNLVQTSWLNFISHTCCSLYSPDIALCDLFQFSKMKMLLKWNRFQDMEEIK